MDTFEKALQETKSFLDKRLPFLPQIGVILGTGLSSLVDEVSVQESIPYQEIPHFPSSTVETHSGNLILGSWNAHQIAVLQGRVHYYEGYTLQEVTFPVRALRKIGVSTLIITNAAGGLDPNFVSGDIMAITDHINLLGENPLRGPNVDSLGGRFPSMNEPYSKDLIAEAGSVAEMLGIKLQKGVYVGVQGPSLETAAETRFLRTIGADAVGMSTVPEVIAAVHAGMDVMGLSVISNVNIPESIGPATLEEVVANVKKAEPNLAGLIGGVLDRLQS
jgi:purine-nucleoside phosphorylase